MFIGDSKLSKKLNGKPGQFQASDFVPTKWNTARDKAEMANKITKFVLNGFQRPSFKKEMYKRISCMFGHVAEYDEQGFYLTWFESNAACLRWVENVLQGGILGFIAGDPAWTWSDVEKNLQQRMTENHIREQIMDPAPGFIPMSVIADDQQHTQLTLFQE